MLKTRRNNQAKGRPQKRVIPLSVIERLDDFTTLHVLSNKIGVTAQQILRWEQSGLPTHPGRAWRFGNKSGVARQITRDDLLAFLLTTDRLDLNS